ncbi:phage tail sheath family protein [Mycetohabitans rhizoxinica]|uniref:Phage tail sheath family protein n=1 Tax=Mycetohabitans rhizoxinica TaxID=412963 RepID=A0ABZ2PXN0_9BURK
MSNECKEGMMADYKVPGVYVEEPFGLALSIQTGQTAVPVFAFDASQLAAWEGAIDGAKVTQFDSWLAVTAALNLKRQEKVEGAINKLERKSETEEKSAGETAGNEFDNALAINALYQSLKLYFLNGGGYCYVAPVDQLTALVPALDDVTLLVQAGADQGSFKSAVAALCGVGKMCFAIFDGPNSELNTKGASDSNDVAKQAEHYPDTPYAAVYYPWLTVDGVENVTHFPPSGAVAGVYARVDRERGVWKAPANVEIIGAQPVFKVSDAVNAKANVPDSGGKSINVIRAFHGTGPLIWGARTLQSNQTTWRYVPVRRLFNAVEKDVKTAMSPALFEPNSAPTWERVRGAVDNYLHGLWKQGALQGSTPAQAYFVQIGLGVTMVQDDIDNGRMIIKVGLAAVRPAEFIVLQLTQDVVSA